MSRAGFAVVFVAILLCAMNPLFRIMQVEAYVGTVYIEQDGSVNPSTAAIERNGSLYTFTGNINAYIVVQKGDIVINGNGYTLEGGGSDYGFYLYSVDNVTVENATIQNCLGGVHLLSSLGDNISGNIITNNIHGGVLVESSNNSVVSGNKIWTNGAIGVEVFGSTNNTVSGNDIRNNWIEEGIEINHSTDNIISGNNITDNLSGIFLANASSNLVSENNISDNLMGFFIASSSNNSFLQNYMQNSQQVFYDTGSVNTWSSSNPIMGNYWSDYQSKYPNASEIDSSNIWNTPYEINADNIDYYPMVKYVIPEFPSFLILPLFMAATLFAFFVYRKKRTEFNEKRN